MQVNTDSSNVAGKNPEENNLSPEQIEKIKRFEKATIPSPFLKKFGAPIIYAIVVIIVGGACLLNGLPIMLTDSIWIRSIVLLLLPLTFPLTMVAICAVINKPFQGAIASTLVPRDLSLPFYFSRRVYGACLATLMHFTGIYYIILSLPWLKKFMFVSFGYPGKYCNFTTYTDVWMRDLKLLDLGDRAYLGNQSTLGTNICTTDGKLLVGKIKIGDDTQLGRLCILGPGARIGNQSETGVRTIFGLKVIIKNRVKIAGGVSISHGVVLEDGVTVSEYCYLGSKCHIYEGITIPAAINLKSGTIVTSQGDLNSHIDLQNQDIRSTIIERMAMMNDKATVMRQ
jgi:acetyltransferase-like isoleucine patch superfamily enzyme